MAFSKGSFNVLESEHAAQAGRKGGQSRSRAKTRAARQNGEAGGRPPTRTLAERLLGRKLQPGDRAFDRAMDDLYQREQQVLAAHFGCHHLLDSRPLHTKLWRQRSRRPPAEIRYIIRKIKLAFEHYLPRHPPTNITPKDYKDYIVVRVPKYPGEREAWERQHPDMPFVPTRPKKLYFKTMDSFRYLDFMLSKSPNRNFTVEDIKSLEGSRLPSEAAAEALLEYLKFKHKPS